MNHKASAKTQERFQLLLMHSLDGEITPEQQQEFEKLVTTFPEFHREREELNDLKEVLKTMKFKNPPEKIWELHWLKIYNRIERGLAWILVSIGAVILITFGLFKFVESLLADTKIVMIVKIGILAALTGAVILFVSVIREKLILKKQDPYKEIQR